MNPVSVELRICGAGNCYCGTPQGPDRHPTCEHQLVCDWGVIEHPDPRPDHHQVGHLMLATGWWVGGLLDKGPLPIDGYGLVNVKSEDDRLFLQMTAEDRSWTWELFEAHWWDGQGPEILVGRWPD